MAISQELLDLLVCPVCKTPVKLTADEKGLRCAPFGWVFFLAIFHPLQSAQSTWAVCKPSGFFFRELEDMGAR